MSPQVWQFWCLHGGRATLVDAATAADAAAIAAERFATYTADRVEPGKVHARLAASVDLALYATLLSAQAEEIHPGAAVVVLPHSETEETPLW